MSMPPLLGRGEMSVNSLSSLLGRDEPADNQRVEDGDGRGCLGNLLQDHANLLSFGSSQ